MVGNIVRNEDGTVTFPSELMELVEHVSTLIAGDPKIRAFTEANAGKRDHYGWVTLIMGLAISQCS